MKFNLKDFLELDTKSLLAVNGGTDCSGSSSPSSPSDSDGLLSSTEIKDGMNDYLDAVFGDIYDVKTNTFEKELSNEKFIEVSQLEDTYILARAYGDFDSNGKNEHHWIVLEGYTTDKNGRLIFNYDGTSDNDVGRTYVLGDDPNPLTKTASIVGLECYTINKKI